MITSCKECKTNCCKSGPGPHIPIPVETFLRNYATVWNYNKKCGLLTEEGKCDFHDDIAQPLECKSLVCQVRSFSPKELEQIHTVTEEEYIQENSVEEDDN